MMNGWDITMPWPNIKTEPVDNPQQGSPEYKPVAFDPSLINGMPNFTSLAFNPLTPPGYPNVLLQPSNPQRPDTPCTSRDANLTPIHTPPMDVTPPKSPKSPKDSRSTPNTSEASYDESEYCDDIRTPKVNSHGKIKSYKCKQCGYVAITKADFWHHQRSHMKPEKILNCPKCPFVTEFKHHLEYHQLNHSNSKPFKCPKCSYRCVNNSMLSSHLKSHSSVFQYRCSDCSYATKYCHSLKQHLRKYTHKPGPVLNEDGSPNPLPIIDVYGSRRGPRTKSKVKGSALSKERLPSAPPAPPPQHPLNFASISKFYLEILARQNFVHMENHDEALNLVQKEQPPAPPIVKTNRRKGQAFKLDRSFEEDTSQADATYTSSAIVNHNEEHINVSSCSKEDPPSPSSNSNNHNNNNNNNNRTSPSPKSNVTGKNREFPFECKHCDISFKDQVLHSIHIGYHGFNDIFKCNMCGEQCEDKISFFLHIARNSHP